MFLTCEYITVIFASLQKFILTLKEFQGCLFSCFPEHFSVLFWEPWIIALLSCVPKLLSSLKQSRNLMRILSPPSSELPWVRPWTDFVEDRGSVLPLWCGPAPWEHSPALPTPTPTHCASLLSQTMPWETGSKVPVKRRDLKPTASPLPTRSVPTSHEEIRLVWENLVLTNPCLLLLFRSFQSCSGGKWSSASYSIIFRIYLFLPIHFF